MFTTVSTGAGPTGGLARLRAVERDGRRSVMADRRRSADDRGVHPVTDVHTHYVPHGWPPLPGTGDRPTLRVDGPAEATIMLGERAFRRITDTAWNADVRLAAMDRCGVDRQVLSPTPVFFSYDQRAGAAAATAVILNDLALDIAAQAPQRLVPFCQVPSEHLTMPLL